MKTIDFQNLIRINQEQLKPGETQWFIQLGANDGIMCEGYGLRSILLEQKHNAILVEPLPEVFERCKENYKDAVTCYISAVRLSTMINKEHQHVFNLKFKIE
jgi:hypothetical protein